VFGQLTTFVVEEELLRLPVRNVAAVSSSVDGCLGMEVDWEEVTVEAWAE
jgi:hypothetical protein